MGRTLGLVLIVVASGLLIYWFVVPLFVAPPTPPAQTAMKVSTPPTDSPNAASTITRALPSSPAESGQNASAAPAGPALAAPRTSEQREQDDVEAKRAPYYRWLREQAGDRVTDVRLADDDRATLVLYTSIDNPQIVPSLVRDVILPDAYRFGFRHVRFFVPNPAGSVSQYRFDAESDADADGNWTTFHK